jgi:hypothetical protein
VVQSEQTTETAFTLHAPHRVPPQILNVWVVQSEQTTETAFTLHAPHRVPPQILNA